ncbi:2'-5' RNA ligase family protein [Actinoplanes sp. NPDC049118]|uniref:2'-5' RNA ligase family protein n=1 Tax=Actinoplanes sp. NPDC049118 TaxID=3155769 RepID=UPI0033C4487E
MTNVNADSVKDHWYWRPGWHVGARFYTWHITFSGQSEVIRLAKGYRDVLDQQSILDVVPDEWLHLTMQGIGFVNEVSTEDVDSIVAQARQRCANLAPMKLRIGRPHVDPESIQIAIEPAGPVRALRQEIRSSIGEVWGFDRIPEPAEPYNPHMSLAYINAKGPAAPLVKALEEVSALSAEVRISSCQLIVLNRDNGMYVWEPYATVALGESSP